MSADIKCGMCGHAWSVETPVGPGVACPVCKTEIWLLRTSAKLWPPVDELATERTARLAAEARVKAVLDASGKIISGSPGPLYDVGFAHGVKYCQDIARSTLHTGDGT